MKLTIPPPAVEPERPRKVLLTLTDEEKEKLVKVAERRREPIATCARIHLLAALDAALAGDD